MQVDPSPTKVPASSEPAPECRPWDRDDFMRRLVRQVLPKRGGLSDVREVQVPRMRPLRRDSHIANAAAHLRRLVLQILQKRGQQSDVREAQVQWMRPLRRDSRMRRLVLGILQKRGEWPELREAQVQWMRLLRRERHCLPRQGTGAWQPVGRTKHSAVKVQMYISYDHIIYL